MAHYLIDAETLEVIRQATVGEYARSLTARFGYIVAGGRRCYVDALLVAPDDNADNSTNQGTETMNNANDVITAESLSRWPDEIIDMMTNDGSTHQLIDSETLDVLRPATISELQASLAAGPEGHILIDGRRCFVD